MESQAYVMLACVSIKVFWPDREVTIMLMADMAAATSELSALNSAEPS